jgi:hypothetical protein
MGLEASSLLTLFGAGGGAAAGAAATPKAPEKGAAVGAVGGAALGMLFGSPQVGGAIGTALGGLFGGKAKKSYQVNALPALAGEYYGSRPSKERKVLRYAWKPINNEPAFYAGLRIAKSASENPQSVDWITDSDVAAVYAAYEGAKKGTAAPIAGAMPATPQMPAQLVSGVTPSVAGALAEKEVALGKPNYMLIAVIGIAALVLVMFVMRK